MDTVDGKSNSSSVRRRQVANGAINQKGVDTADVGDGDALSWMDVLSIGSRINLKRTVGLWSGSSFIVGGIIGSGIFISPQGVTLGAGSVGLSLTIWIICGVISMMGALCFAEMGTMLPQSGAEYSYLRIGFGDLIGFLVAWLYILLLNPSGNAVMGMTCATYLLTPLFDDGCGEPPDDLIRMVGVAVLCLLAAVNCTSVWLAERIQVIFTIAKLCALIFIIMGGIAWLCRGYTENITAGWEGTETDISKIVMAFYSCFWSYSGWGNLNYVTEELKEPSKNLPRAIILSVTTVTIIYLLTNISYYTVLSVDEMKETTAVGVAWAAYVIPNAPWLIPVCVAMSTFGSVNGSFFTSPRMSYVAGRNGHMVNVLSMIHVHRLCPSPAVIFMCILGILFVIPANISAIMDLFNFIIWIVYFMVFLMLLIWRWTHKDMERPYKVPILIPIVMLFVSMFLVLVPLISDPKAEYMFAIGFILLGCIVYVPVIWKKHYLPGMDRFTAMCQSFLQCMPPEDISAEQNW